jgi:hypothetical protein
MIDLRDLEHLGSPAESFGSQEPRSEMRTIALRQQFVDTSLRSGAGRATRC